MAYDPTLRATKGSELTHNEVDANFSALKSGGAGRTTATVLECSEKASFTPAMDWTNCTWTGQQWRMGNVLFLEIEGIMTGAHSAGDMVLTLPDSLSADTTIFNASYQGMPWGACSCVDATNGNTYMIAASLQNATAATKIRFYTLGGSLGSATVVALSATVPFTWAVSDTISLRVAVPISGWNTTKTIAVFS